jgi:alkaline phosphatase
VTPRIEQLEQRQLLSINRLQILHASDLEGGVNAIADAPNFAAVVEALEADAASADTPSILLSAGDNYIPGPFFNAAGDRSLRDDLQTVYQELFNQPGLTNIREGAGRVDVSIMNILGFDASALGNHEFDPGTRTLRDIIGTDIRDSNDDGDLD